VVQAVVRMVVPDRVLGRWLGRVVPQVVAESDEADDIQV
jgi:hypothetical protein